MDDLISREGYKKVIDEQLRFYDPDLSPWHVKILELQRELLDSMPAVDAAPVVHGNWKIMSHGFPPEPSTVCSHCGLDIDHEICKRIKADSFSYTSMKPNYCPNCGAKMIGD